ncbi:transcription elongation factor SPT6 [Plectosphaerella plurivora]|uniref:Transcription elongation factor Spt6 n=1 Tax=Plectosphaerella plurivora TaxID=936078 RepID=A0A9P8V1V0_9PEZI|nr:transcription elongation factor SPT6 [Plectosphaerella plurivora]
MSASIRDMVLNEADLDEEDDESYDEEGGEERAPRNNNVEDSSEEEDDDDDEEEAAKIREGFIVDEDEDEGEDSDAHERVVKRKREHRDRGEEEQLDEDDLELIGEREPKAPVESKFKRLKRGHRDENERSTEHRGLEDIFSDDEDVANERPYGRSNYRQQADEFDDFIEEDFPEDEEARIQAQEDAEVARPRDRGMASVVDTAGLDKDALEDFEAIFGVGEDYGWALALEDEQTAQEREEQTIELKDVFEPSQLTEKLLTDEDNEIRFTDEPERFQIDRKPFKQLQLSAEQFKEEARWITSLIWPKKGLPGDLHSPFTKAIGKVLEFFVVDEVEVPYVFQHRKDYLIHTKKMPNHAHRDDPEAPPFIISAEKLLTQDDLWRILELDIKFRSLMDKRNTLEKTFESLKAELSVQDEILQQMIPQASSMEELQDLQDYLHFQYASELKDLASLNGSTKNTKRPGSKAAMHDRVRKSRAYGFVKAYGISPDRLAQNALREGSKVWADDDGLLPDDLADALVDDEFPTGEAVFRAARQMYADELFVSPRMRRHFRANFYEMGDISCHRTEKGLRKIDEAHPFYEVKYLKHQSFADLARQPHLFLKMMKAEEEGLIEVHVALENDEGFKRQLRQEFISDNYSERADRWNDERQRVLDIAVPRLLKHVAKGVKETVRTACQEEVFAACRDEYSNRIDQAPYKPKGMVLGTTPRVLTISNGGEDPGRVPLCWASMDEEGRFSDHGKLDNLLRNDATRQQFCDLVQQKAPDVIGVSGWTADTHRLVRELESLVSERGLMGAAFDDPETGETRIEPLEVIIVNDEVARLYKDSPRGLSEHPTIIPLTRYCIALARYMQNPLKEYAALGKDITTLSFHPCQQLLPQDKLMRHLESAMVDMVNLCGVNINEAVSDPYTANLLPFVSGLGPRKATSVLKAINANGGSVNTRDELVGDPDSGKLPVVGPRVFNNCASFLFIEFEPTNENSEPLDNTRVHPEDYDLGRKMAADALELDEEDVSTEVAEGGPGAVVRKLFKEDQQDRVNELILEEYAEQLEDRYSQKKRATLETIRAELQAPYEELRKNFSKLEDDQVFTMLTGETKDSLAENMIIPTNVRVVKDEFAIVKLDCGIEGRIESSDGPDGDGLRGRISTGQTIQAKILSIDMKGFVAKLSIRERDVRTPYRRRIYQPHGQWDERLEAADREELREKDKSTGRTQRVINHMLFKPFNGIEAEQWLGGQPNGEIVVRPSSKGNDHLAITWKVADGVFQHVDVLELQKPNDFSLGKFLRVGRVTYPDLDELIHTHIEGMAKKVDELMQHDKFEKRSRAEVEKWLTTYLDANPNSSAYAFCIDPKHAGYFWLMFKAGKNERVNALPVKVMHEGYELLKNKYPDMRGLCNGFKLMYQNEIAKKAKQQKMQQQQQHHYR